LPIAAADTARITIRLRPELGASPESYTLLVSREDVRIEAVAVQGALHAVQTVRQLLPDEVFSPNPARSAPLQASCAVISDAPWFPWRGAMLDVARHFMPLDFVLRFVDLLAAHKFNTLHLHLTDDQGWRLEIGRYPLLTQVGAWRDGTMIGHKDSRHDGVPHGGYYSKADIKQIVRHAAARGVTVVPEIDFPAHTQAAIAAYPWLSDTGRQVPVATGWGNSEHVLNVTDRTLDFCEGVLDEVMALFPSRYVHVGGDECPKAQWRASAQVQARISELGLSDENALYSWFLRQLTRFVLARGRRPVAWVENNEGAMPDRTTVMSWRGEDGGVTAARLGHDVIMTPMTRTYFDQYQSSDRSSEPLATGGLIDVPSVHGYQPIPKWLEPRYHHHVLGSQFQVWTEYIRTPSHAEYMAFPRACALADALWNPQSDLDDFNRRLAEHLGRLRALGVSYRPVPVSSPNSTLSIHREYNSNESAEYRRQ
jgi:hexosaminidase